MHRSYVPVQRPRRSPRLHAEPGHLKGLENRIFFDLEQGTGGSFNDCTGFTPTANTVPELPLSTLARSPTATSPPAAPLDTTGTPGETQSYRGTWRFDTTNLSQDEVNALQGARVSIDLVWDSSPTTLPPPRNSGLATTAL